jgi:hypothetical protein
LTRYYTNKITGDMQWDMPDEVRFYLPKALEEQLLTIFNYGQIFAFQMAFSALDLDRSGELSIEELKLFFNLLKIDIDKSKFDLLVKVVDANGNGTVEYDEFCWMIYEFSSKDKTGLWMDLDFSNILGADYESKINMSTLNSAMAGVNKNQEYLAKQQLNRQKISGSTRGGNSSIVSRRAVAASQKERDYEVYNEDDESDEDDEDDDDGGISRRQRSTKIHSKFCFCGCRGRKEDF